jgi:hypothetical protein
MSVVIYIAATGRIVGVGSAPWAPSDLAGAYGSKSTTDVADHAVSYIAGSPPAVTARPATVCPLDKTTITANGTDTATLSSIPIGASVTVIDGNGTTTYTATDSTLEITADEPGTVTVTVTPAFPYTPLTVTVTAS